MSLNNLAIRLSEIGRRADALAPAQEAVEIRRALAKLNPDAFQPDLASSLNNLANRLSEMGRRADALAPAQEAVELYRALAKLNPDAFQPALAMSLGMRGGILEANERREEALAGFAEGVSMLTRHFQEFPTAHAGRMAGLLQDYLRLSEVLNKEPDEALLAPVMEVFTRLQKESLSPT
jgi:tetratricopeptide (TPR) repeat protein